MAVSQCNVAAIDLAECLSFLKSVAVARALDETTQVTWEPYMQSTVINFVYNVMPFKERLGFMEVHQASKRQVGRRIAERYEQFVNGWLASCASGPSAFKNHFEKMNRVRSESLDNLSRKFSGAAEVNAQVLAQLRTSIRGLAAVQMTGTIAVAVLGAYAAIVIGGTAAVLASGTSLALSVTNSVIKEWNSLPSARVLGISKEVGKGAANEVLARSAEKLYSQAAEEYVRSSDLWHKASEKIDYYSRQAASTGRSKVRGKAMQKMVEHQTARQAAASGTRSAANQMVRAGMYRTGIPIVFALWDSVDAVNDFSEVWSATQ